MGKLSEGVEILIGAAIFVLFMVVLSGKTDINIALIWATVAGAVSVIIMEKL